MATLSIEPKVLGLKFKLIALSESKELSKAGLSIFDPFPSLIFISVLSMFDFCEHLFSLISVIKNQMPMPSFIATMLLSL